jgi:hypothetical protein
MANTITENKLNPTSTEFSDLAWRFNNLNSTAKMLLVGTNSQSVPFIPISELAYETASLEKDSSLSLSALTAASAIPTTIKPASTSSPATTNTFKPLQFERKTETIPEYKPPTLEETKKPESFAETNLPLAPVYESSAFSPVAVPKPEGKKEENNAFIPFPIPQQEQSEEYAQPEPNNSWSYRVPYLEEYSDSVNNYEVEERRGSFWGPFLKTTGVVSALALVCAGAFYFFNHNKKAADNASLDELDNNLSQAQTEPSTNTLTSSASSSNKTFVDESPKKTSSTSSPSEDTNGYYKPTIQSSPVKTKSLIKKPKTYKAPSYKQVYNSPKTQRTTNTQASPERVNSGYPYSSDAETNTYTPPATVPKAKPQPLFDPSTVYDSSAVKAINPETYTAEEFPIEISYTKQSAQHEAAFIPSNSTAQTNLIAPTSIPSPSTEEELSDDKTELDTQEPSSAPLYTKPISGTETPPSDSFDSKPEDSSPIYSKPVSQATQEIEESNKIENTEDESLNEPILRKPVQSSSNEVNNDVFSSPYKQEVGNLTTTMVVQNKPRQPMRKTSFFRRKKYTQEYRREAAVNNANSAINAYQDRLREIQRKAEANNLTNEERTKLLSEIEVLKRNITETQKELDETQQKVISVQPVEKELKQVESEANKVYLKPNFEEESEDDDSLNISSL